MTPQDLITECQKQIDICGEGAEKTLVIRGRWGKKNYRTLFGVKGEIVLERERDIVVMFPAKQLKEAVEEALAKIEVAESKGGE